MPNSYGCQDQDQKDKYHYPKLQKMDAPTTFGSRTAVEFLLQLLPHLFRWLFVELLLVFLEKLKNIRHLFLVADKNIDESYQNEKEPHIPYFFNKVFNFALARINWLLLVLILMPSISAISTCLNPSNT